MVTDAYLLFDKKCRIYGVLEVELDFDVTPISTLTLEDALYYLNKNNIEYRLKTGIRGNLYFKEK